MSDDHRNNPFDPAEPARDLELGALLRRATGDVPVASVDWDALASRISRALPAGISAMSAASTSWWSYAARWERRMLPLALAASLVGALALWGSSHSAAATVSRTETSESIADMVQGTSPDDVARTFARSVTADVAYGEPVPE